MKIKGYNVQIDNMICDYENKPKTKLDVYLHGIRFLKRFARYNRVYSPAFYLIETPKVMIVSQKSFNKLKIKGKFLKRLQTVQILNR